MKKILIQYAMCALVVALMAQLARAQSQPAGLQAAFATDAGTLSEKFTGRADSGRRSRRNTSASAPKVRPIPQRLMAKCFVNLLSTRPDHAQRGRLWGPLRGRGLRSLGSYDSPCTGR